MTLIYILIAIAILAAAVVLAVNITGKRQAHETWNDYARTVHKGRPTCQPTAETGREIYRELQQRMKGKGL